MMNSVWIIAISIAAGLAILTTIGVLAFGRRKTRLLRLVQARFPREDMVLMSGANFFGQRARGPDQIRGAGALVLTRAALTFLRAAPPHEHAIPIAAIRAVSLPRSYEGKTIFRPLLCVRYKGDIAEDELVWAVQDPERWRQAIETVRTSLS